MCENWALYVYWMYTFNKIYFSVSFSRAERLIAFAIISRYDKTRFVNRKSSDYTLITWRRRKAVCRCSINLVRDAYGPGILPLSLSLSPSHTLKHTHTRNCLRKIFHRVRKGLSELRGHSRAVSHWLPLCLMLLLQFAVLPAGIFPANALLRHYCLVECSWLILKIWKSLRRLLSI